MTISLNVTAREGALTAGHIPAVVYGPKQESVSLAIEKQKFEKLFAEAGESTIVVLEGLAEPIEVLVHDVAFDPVRGGVQHVDFYAIERGKELTTNVSLEFVGEAPITKTGASVTKALHEVEVTCRPSVLPKHIEVDISNLTTVDDVIRVSDLVVPEGVKVENDPEETVVVVSAAKEEEPEQDTEPVDMASVEVEAKGKADEEGDSATE